MGAQHIGFAPMPAVALILSRFDRAQLGSFVEIAIELMDVAQGDTDLEPEVTEQDDEPEIDDEPELDDHGGGNVEDEGESIEVEDAGYCGDHAVDQRDVILRGASFRID